jgi:hypothetical protein
MTEVIISKRSQKMAKREYSNRTRMWDEAAKGKTTPSASAAFEPFGCRCRGFLVLAHACAASSEVWVAASLIEAHSHYRSLILY